MIITKDQISKAAFLGCLLLFLAGPWLWHGFRNYAAGAAVAAGAALALTLGNPWPGFTAKNSARLLGVSIVGLGFGMNFERVLRAGLTGFGYTALGIATGIGLGLYLGRRLRVNRDTAWLISVGTAICGGSAIAAAAPVLRAKPHEIAMATAAVFLLNACALWLFPPLGRAMGLSQESFGLWAALAIHDTSSVVGATLQYGPIAQELGTTVKLARALWIVPLTLCISWTVSRREATCSAGDSPLGSDRPRVRWKLPWFIPGFLIAAAVVTYVPGAETAGPVLKRVAESLLVTALFLVGCGLSRDRLRQLGYRPFLLAMLLWIILGTGWGIAVKLGIAGWNFPNPGV